MELAFLQLKLFQGFALLRNRLTDSASPTPLWLGFYLNMQVISIEVHSVSEVVQSHYVEGGGEYYLKRQT